MAPPNPTLPRDKETLPGTSAHASENAGPQRDEEEGLSPRDSTFLDENNPLTGDYETSFPATKVLPLVVVNGNVDICYRLNLYDVEFV